jgi:hypothetical protein
MTHHAPPSWTGGRWGEEAIVAIARQRTAFVVLIYPRNHLDRTSLLNEPVALPPGTRPLFLDCVMDAAGDAMGSTLR